MMSPDFNIFSDLSVFKSFSFSGIAIKEADVASLSNFYYYETWLFNAVRFTVGVNP